MASGYCEQCKGFFLNLEQHNQQRHPAPAAAAPAPVIAAPAPIDLYLVGHGFLADPLHGNCDVPASITLQFYCDPQAKFDSHWEGDILGGSYANDHAWLPDALFRHGWHPNEVAAGTQGSANHVLTFPGGVQGTHSLPEMVAIERSAAGVQIGENFGNANRRVLYVGKSPSILRREHPALVDDELDSFIESKNYAYLSEILAAITVVYPNPAIVHWCACRDLYDAASVRSAATNGYLGRVRQDIRHM